MLPAFLWRFPVPYREVFAGGTWILLLALSHWSCARSVLRSKWPSVRRYIPIVLIHCGLFYLFLGLAFVFTRLSTTAQIVWILVFPSFTIIMKKWLWTNTRRLDDVSTDVTVCVIEIYRALYRSVCLQLLQSVGISMLLIFIDIVHALIDVGMFARYEFLVDGASTIGTAVKIVESSLFPGSADERVELPSQPTTNTPRPMMRRITWHNLEHASVAPPMLSAATRTSSTRTLQAHSKRSTRRVSTPNVYVTKSPNSVFMRPADYIKRTASRRRLLNLTRNSVVHARDSTASTTASSGSANDMTARFTGIQALARRETSVQIDNLLVKRKDQARILEQSLQLLFTSDVLVFAEFVQVLIPLIYST